MTAPHEPRPRSEAETPDHPADATGSFSPDSALDPAPTPGPASGAAPGTAPGATSGTGGPQPAPRPRGLSAPQWGVLALIAAVTIALIGVTAGGSTEDGPGAAPAGPTAPAAPPADPPAPGDGPAGEVLEPEAPELVDVARRDPGDPLADGPVDAPVTLLVYSDYQCPYCAVWHEQTLPVMREYAAAGALRIEWRDVNVLGPTSARAARAAYAAGLQGAFWEYHEELFAGGDRRPAEDLTDEGLVAIAAGIGLDADRLAADMASAEVGAAVLANEQEGQALGAFSTPSFLVGGRPVVGAQPTEVFVAAVEEALAREAG